MRLQDRRTPARPSTVRVRHVNPAAYPPGTPVPLTHPDELRRDFPAEPV